MAVALFVAAFEAFMMNAGDCLKDGNVSYEYRLSE